MFLSIMAFTELKSGRLYGRAPVFWRRGKRECAKREEMLHVEAEGRRASDAGGERMLI